MEHRSVTAYLAEEHRRMDEQIETLARAVHGGRLEDARDGFLKLTRALFRHIDAEERALLPLLERLPTPARDITKTMRVEHAQLCNRVLVIMKILDAGDLRGAWDRIAELCSLLEAHDDKEERVVCPAIDRALASKDERRLLLRRMTALSRDASRAA